MQSQMVVLLYPRIPVCMRTIIHRSELPTPILINNYPWAFGDTLKFPNTDWNSSWIPPYLAVSGSWTGYDSRLLVEPLMSTSDMVLLTLFDYLNFSSRIGIFSVWRCVTFLFKSWTKSSCSSSLYSYSCAVLEFLMLSSIRYSLFS